MNETGTLCIFKLLLAGKVDKETPESSRLTFLEKILTKNITSISDTEGNTLGPLNRGERTDLHLVGTLLGTRQKLQ